MHWEGQEMLEVLSKECSLQGNLNSTVWLPVFLARFLKEFLYCFEFSRSASAGSLSHESLPSDGQALLMQLEEFPT